VIPINADLVSLLTVHRAWFVHRFSEPEHCVFPFGSPQPTQPDKPVANISSGWGLVRKRAGVLCRMHDLRHMFCTRLAEAGVAESVMLALMGRMSRSMLERYSHIRMAAKREAVAPVRIQ
jgi:integrase